MWVLRALGLSGIVSRPPGCANCPQRVRCLLPTETKPPVSSDSFQVLDKVIPVLSKGQRG